MSNMEENSSTLSFAMMPLELATAIYRYLGPIENCLLSQTNHFWHDLCGNDSIWKNFCRERFQLNNLTSNGFKKLVWTYPHYMSSWKDWYSFRSQFRREVAGSIEIEVIEVVLDSGEKLKKIPQKNLVADYTCFSQPLQSSYGARTSTFSFDEYHTIIQCDLFENKSWFYNKGSCLGRAIIPVFAAKQQVSHIWVELEDVVDEPTSNGNDDMAFNADSEYAVMSDDEFTPNPTIRFGDNHQAIFTTNSPPSESSMIYEQSSDTNTSRIRRRRRSSQRIRRLSMQRNPPINTSSEIDSNNGSSTSSNPTSPRISSSGVNGGNSRQVDHDVGPLASPLSSPTSISHSTNQHRRRKRKSQSIERRQLTGNVLPTISPPGEPADQHGVLSDGDGERRGRPLTKFASIKEDERRKTSKSAPTSPKRRRNHNTVTMTKPLSDSSSSIPNENNTSHNSMNHSSSTPPLASSPVQLSSPQSISRPSSPIHSITVDHPHQSMNVASSSSHSTNSNFQTSKRKSSELKRDSAFSMAGAVAEQSTSPSWFSFLSSSPPILSLSSSNNDYISPPPIRQARTIKRVLFQVTMNPVQCSVQDFEIVASISRGAFHTPNQLFLVKDKDSNNPQFMKIITTIGNTIDDEEGGGGRSLTLEGSKNSVSYSTFLRTQMPSHPFLVELFNTFQTDNKLYLLMEWLGGGELFSALRRTRHGRFEENEVLFYTAQLILGLEHMHQHKVIYRDLKPENLLLSADGNLKITQRTPPESCWEGLTRPSSNFTILTGHSLPEYLAPEVLKGLMVTIKVDSWSVGTVMYHMLVGQPPFLHANIQSLITSIINDDVDYPDFLSVNSVNLLKGLLHKDARKRFSLKNARNHEFFEGLDWNKMLRKEYLPPITPFRRQDLYFNISKHLQSSASSSTSTKKTNSNNNSNNNLDDTSSIPATPTHASTNEKEKQETAEVPIPPSASRHMSL